MSATTHRDERADRRRSRAALLVLATSGTSWILACITPFAAFATIAARGFPGREAVAVVGALWLVNQAIGYLVLGYPRTPDSFGWGVAIGLATLLALLAARATLRSLRRTAPALGVAVAFLAAFAAYQGGLFAASFVLSSGSEAFAATVVLRVFQVNAVAFGALLLLDALIGRARVPARPRPLPVPAGSH